MIQAILPAVIGLLGKAVDKAIPDKTQAAELKAKITEIALTQSHDELKGAVEIITSEATGESWLQRNWRPLLMLTFGSLIVAHWLGYTAENLSEAEILMLLEIVKIGIGGYIVGRSAEKAVKAWKRSD